MCSLEVVVFSHWNGILLWSVGQYPKLTLLSQNFVTLEIAGTQLLIIGKK